MRRLKFWAAAIFVVLTVSISAAFLLVPYAVKNIAPKIVKQEFNASLSIESVDFSLFPLKLSIDGVKLDEPNGNLEFLRIKHVELCPDVYAVFYAAAIIKSVWISGVSANIKRDTNGKLNFEKFIKPKKDDSQTRFAVNNIRISSSTIRFFDENSSKSVTVEQLNMAVPFISNFPDKTDIFVTPQLAMSINGTRLLSLGKTKPFSKSQESEISITVKDFSLLELSKYIPKTALDATLEGMLQANIKASFEKNQKSENIFSAHCDANISSLTLKTDGQSLQVGSILLKNAYFSNAKISQKSFGAEALVIDKASVDVKKSAHESSKIKESQPFSFELNSTTITSSNVIYTDGTLSQPLILEMSSANLTLGRISDDENEEIPFSLDAKVQKTGLLRMNGTVLHGEKSAKLDIEAKNIPLTAVNSLSILPPKLQLTDAKASAKGTLSFLLPDITYKGSLLLKSFELTSKTDESALINFETLSLEKIDMDTKSRQINIGSLALSNFYTDISIDKNGSLNLLSYMAKEPQAAQKNERVPWSTNIEKITVQGGEIDFEDGHVQPAFSANLHNIGGRISSLRLNTDTPSQIDLSGAVGSFGEIKIAGQVVPSSKNFSLLLNSRCTNIAMPPFTPYSEKFLGYKLQTGSLQLDLAYSIVGKELNASNKITLKKLDLGDEVDSPDAIRLPIKLAIALLKDSSGDIDIDLPVEGSTDNPEIRSGRVIWTLILNLFKKIITAPFAVLGSIFGGGEELKFVKFDYATAVLSTTEKQKLDKVVKILISRPALKLRLEGYYDSEKDAQQIKNSGFEAKLKAVSANANPDEYEKYLKVAYSHEKFPKPKNLFGFDKDLTKEEMKKLILANIPAGEKELSQLVKARVEAVRDYLLQNTKELQNRIEISVVSGGKRQKEDKAPNACVELTLK